MPRSGSQRKTGLKKVGVIRAAHYERCSSDDHRFKDFSTIENQHDRNTRHIQEKGWKDVGGYSDRGKTGTNLERKGFQQLLTDAQAGALDVVTVTYMSRLARGPAYHAAEYLLRMAGVDVEMVEETFGDDFTGQMSKEFTILVDGIQPKQAGLHTKTKMEGMVSRGYVCGVIPFGYKAVFAAEGELNAEKEPPKRPMPDEDEAPLVRTAFEMARQRCTQASIREYLKMVAPQSRRWTTTQVKQLLTNEFYLGVLKFGDWRNEAAHEPLVDRETWDAVQQVFERPAGRPPKNADNYSYYLRGRVHCPHCHCPYTQVSVPRSKRVHYYACLEANKHHSDCPVKRVNADALHFTVLSLIERSARHHTVMHSLIAKSGGWGVADEVTRTLRGQLGKKLQFLGLQIENTWKMADDGRGHDLVMSRLERLQREQRDVAEKMKAVDAEIEKATIKRPEAAMVCASWGRLVDLWNVLTEEERALSLQSLVEHVDMTTKDRVLLRLSPIAEVHGQMLAINSRMGAGRFCNLNRLSSIRSCEAPPHFRKCLNL